MTTRERLHQLVDQMDGPRAEAWLAVLSPGGDGADGHHLGEAGEDIDAITARDLERIAGMRPLTIDRPLGDFVGMVGPEYDGPTDVSARVDDYLAKAYADLHDE